MCPKLVDPSQQMQTLNQQLFANNLRTKFNRLWLVLVPPSDGCYSWGNPADNCNYLKQVIHAGDMATMFMGMLSSASGWAYWFGNCDVSANGFPLAWWNEDYSANMTSFKPFGPWTQPLMKRYTYNTNSLCGVTGAAYLYRPSTAAAVEEAVPAGKDVPVLRGGKGKQHATAA
jgi:hypothetical protein